MTPFPTVDDVLPPRPVERCEIHECCRLGGQSSVSTSVFTCTNSESENVEDEMNLATDRQESSASIPNNEDGDIMSLDRLFCPISRAHCGRCSPAVTMVRRNKSNGGQKIFYTDVVVVGNGPSALALSAFLAGHCPYYDGVIPHPDQSLHEKLNSDKSKSLLQQDLKNLCEGLEGRTGHQVSVLYDYLVRPEADIGHENPSTLKWQKESASIDNRFCPNRNNDNQKTHVAHVVLGKGAVGGTWADLPPEVMTLSFASWLDLPAYSFREWLEKDGANFATDLQMKIDTSKVTVGRVPCAAVRRYYRDYVRGLDLEGNIFEYSLVTSVRKRWNPEIDPEYGWDVHGCYSGGTFHFRCRHVVLATGVSVPRRLGIPGEENPLVLHSTSHLDRMIQELDEENCSVEFGHRKPNRMIEKRQLDPVLIVGDGLNAADAVIKCLINGIPVIHSFRKTPRDSKQILSKLSKVLYPEYYTIYQLMTASAKDQLYSVYPRTQVQRFEFSHDHENGGIALLRNLKSGSIEEIRFSRVAVLIGYEADLSFLSIDDEEESNSDPTRCQLARDHGRPVDSKMNTLDVDPFTCRCLVEPNLYAIGPLIGDNFVRYVVGGSLAAASDILKRK